MSGLFKSLLLSYHISIEVIAASLWAGIAHRLSAAFSTIPDPQAWLYSAALLLVYALISLPIGFWGGFVQVEILKDSWAMVASIIVGAFLMPGISEELFFRVLLLPHPTENASLAALWLWGCISLVIFLVYHPLSTSKLSNIQLKNELGTNQTTRWADA